MLLFIVCLLATGIFGIWDALVAQQQTRFLCEISCSHQLNLVFAPRRCVREAIDMCGLELVSSLSHLNLHLISSFSARGDEIRGW